LNIYRANLIRFSFINRHPLEVNLERILMCNLTKYLRSALVLSAITAISLGLSAGSVTAQEEDDDKEKEKERVVKVDCDKGGDVQKVLETYAFETKPLVLIIEGICESDETVEVTRNNVEFLGGDEDGGYVTGVLKVEGGRGVSIGDNMMLDDLVIEYGQVFLEAGEGTITINSGVGVNFQSVLTIAAEETDGSVIIDTNISLLNQSLLLIQQDELASAGSVTTGDINASLQSSVNVRDASIGDMYLGSDSQASFDSTVKHNDISMKGTIGCDSESFVWGNVDTGEFIVIDGCLGI